MKDILIVQPPASFENDNPVLPQSSVGIGMLTIMAYIEAHGYSGEVVHIPRALEAGLSMDHIMERICAANPKLIAIGLNWLHFSDGAIRLAEILREKLPNASIVIGGQHATLFSEEIVNNCDAIEGVTVGESEITILKLLESSSRETRKLPPVKGLTYRAQDGRIITSKPEIVEDIDSLPFYGYKYVWPSTEEVCAALDTVRGECVMNCSYCIASKTNSLAGRSCFTAHSPEYLANQIAVFLDEGIDNVTIQDPFSLMGDEHIKQFCQAMLAKNLKLNMINIFVEPSSFSTETMNLLNEIAEIVTLDYGMETGSESVASCIGRAYDKEMLLKDFDRISKLGVKISTWWMTGLPNDTRGALEESMAYIEQTIQHGALPRWVTPLILFPHTDMAKNSETFGVELLMKSFEDFRNYSKVKANNYGVYRELLTHKTKTQTEREIVESTVGIKKGILKGIEKHQDILHTYGWKPRELESIINETKGSFY